MNKIKKLLFLFQTKVNLEPLLKCLQKFNVEINFHTGNTSKEIKILGFKSQEISDYTEFPEILVEELRQFIQKYMQVFLSRRNLKSDK